MEAKIGLKQRLARLLLAFALAIGSLPALSSHVSAANYTLTVETRIDIGWQALSGVAVTVGGITKNTSNGVATFTLSSGSYTITVPSSTSSKSFGHFWDVTKGKDINYNGPTSYTFTVSGNYKIVALYKRPTQITGLSYSGSSVSGKLRDDVKHHDH